MTENPNVEPENVPDDFTPTEVDVDWNAEELGSMADYADDTEPELEN